MVFLCHFSKFSFSCEVIRDWKTGESLCYAFIEFEKVCYKCHSTDMLGLVFILF
jgi:hypothetical protein